MPANLSAISEEVTNRTTDIGKQICAHRMTMSMQDGYGNRKVLIIKLHNPTASLRS